MASTYSSNLKLQLMGTGDNAGAWGDVTNANLGTALEESIVGSADVSFSSSDVTLTLTDTNGTQPARNMRLNLTGTSGGARNLIVPAIEKLYIVNNGLADACTVKVSGQTGVAVPAGKTMFLYNNSTDVVNAINTFNGLNVVGTSMATSQAFVGSIADTTYSGGLINLSNTSRSVGITADPNDAGASSIITFSVDGSEKMRIDTDGDVGIGGAAPGGYRFEVTQGTAADLYTRTYNSDTSSTSDIIHQYRVNNDSANIYIQFGDAASASSGGIRYNHADNSMRFTTNALDNFRMEADGDFHADGDVVAFSTTVSDERLKEDIKVVDSALDKVKQLRGVTFKYKTDGKVSAGVIAQDVEKVLPEAVTEKKLPLKQDDGQEYKTVRYDALHALLIEAVKELSDEVARLKEGK